MGQHCELMAQEWAYPARGAGPARASTATSKAAEAYRSGYMDDLIVPFSGVYRDNNMRDDVTSGKAGDAEDGLRQDRASGTLTAANSTPLTDGAAAVLLASEEWAAKHGLPVLAYLTYAQAAANNFVARRRAVDGADDRGLARCSSAPG